MKCMFWWIVAGIGVACYVGAFRADRLSDDSAPFSSGIIFVSKTAAIPKRPPVSFPLATARLRLLPPTGFSELLLQGFLVNRAEDARDLKLQLSERVLELKPSDIDVAAKSLAWGRAPRPGEREVIAGYWAERQEQIRLGETTLAVVGGLKRDAALLTGSYLIPKSKSSDALFAQETEEVRSAFLVSLASDQLRSQRIRGKLNFGFPPKEFALIVPRLPMTSGPFRGYLLGQALFCLGGSGILIGLYAWAATRVRWRILCDPLSELAARRSLLWCVHLGYFGLYLLAASVVYDMPDVQNALAALTRSAITSGSGPLGIAGTAYASRSIPVAAFVTFIVNFLLGSIIQLTLPSLVIPGSGAIVAAVRATMIGLILAPSSRQLAQGMLLHSGTLLLECEGYILATFFGLLVPVYLLRLESGSSFISRYQKAVGLNLRGNVLIALVLATAAVYEAVELISTS